LAQKLKTIYKKQKLFQKLLNNPAWSNTYALLYRDRNCLTVKSLIRVSLLTVGVRLISVELVYRESLKLWTKIES
ncbi:hypothetical protein BpHYR1_019657, partial [Brachionus plicatilis]